MLRFYATSMKSSMHAWRAQKKIEGAECIQFLAALDILPGQNSQRGMEMNKFCMPPNRRDDLCLCFSLHPSSMRRGNRRHLHNAHVSGLQQQNTFPLCFPACCNFFRGVQGYLYMQKFSRRICVQSQQRTDQQNLDFFHRSPKLKRRQKRSANMASVSKILD